MTDYNKSLNYNNRRVYYRAKWKYIEKDGAELNFFRSKRAITTLYK